MGKATEKARNSQTTSLPADEKKRKRDGGVMNINNVMLQVAIFGGAATIAFVIGWAVGIGELERMKLQVSDIGAATYDLKTGKFVLNEKWTDSGCCSCDVNE